ncbi:MAG TPA: aminotransferase class I/II-fold pyridoxal phosphate-dependent enzyme [Ktedonobacterales bacterium]|nr:aminotransferase class I/II-fold pyridoxal phosphate-dependent enzyme [Ktedonobacterales bacterium]
MEPDEAGGQPQVSAKSQRFTESVIREMTRLATRHNAINLAQGFPDFPAPQAIKDAAAEAIAADINQYAITWGARSLRHALADKLRRDYQRDIDPEREITVCCGATEAMISTLIALLNPGDEVVLFQPFYENYGPDCILAGATPRLVTLHPTADYEWAYDPAEVEAAFNESTRAIVLNTPNNPTGRLFTRAELEHIAGLCRRWNVVAVTDEIYEHIWYRDGDATREHVSIATLPGMAERSVTISGASKTYSVTGWRVGWCIAPAELTAAIRKVHDFVTVGAAAPLQEAVATALRFESAFYQRLSAEYETRRNALLAGLESAGFRCFKPDGAYYIMADIGHFGWPDDVSFTRFLIEQVGVAVVPGGSFYGDAALGKTQVRFCFAKRFETLDAAVERLRGRSLFRADAV